MAYDAHANLAYSLVATAPSPASSGTALVVTAGQGALFPTPPFNCTVWATGVSPLTTNAEIIRVTGISTDTLTIVRAQEGTSARSIVIGDQIANTITVKSLTDIENSTKLIATGNNYKFETTGSGGSLQETTVTASSAVATDSNGLPTASTTTATELSYVHGVTSAIQTQLNNLTGLYLMLIKSNYAL